MVEAGVGAKDTQAQVGHPPGKIGKLVIKVGARRKKVTKAAARGKVNLQGPRPGLYTKKSPSHSERHALLSTPSRPEESRSKDGGCQTRLPANISWGNASTKQ